MTIVYDEVVDFLASGPTPEEIVAFKPSEELNARVEDLIRREKLTGLDRDETAELNHYMQLEHIMRMAKAHARKRLLGKE